MRDQAAAAVLDPASAAAPDVLPPELLALLPDPVQRRGHDTVRAVVDAAVSILVDADAGTVQFTVEEVRRRCGVTTGSIYHHFGDSGRLLAIARAMRFHRSITAAVDASIGRYSTLTSVDELARLTRAQVVARDLPESRAAVWVLADALATVPDLPDLAAAVSASFRHAVMRLEAVMLGMRERGILPADFDPHAALVLSRTLSHARMLDDLDPRPVPHHDWVTVSCRLHDGLLDPQPMPDLGATDRARVASLRTAIVPTDVGAVDGDDSQDDARVATAVARARDLLVAGGPAAVEVGRIRADLGVSAGWFHRVFGDRDALLDAARLDLLRRTLTSEVRSFSMLVARARRPEELVDTVADWVADPPRDPLARRLRWIRTDVLAAARRRPALALEAGRVISALTDTMAEAVADAQAKGLLRPELSSRAVARVAHATVYGAMLIELDGRPVDAATWRHTLRRGLRQLTR